MIYAILAILVLTVLAILLIIGEVGLAIWVGMLIICVIIVRNGMNNYEMSKKTKNKDL